MHKKKTGNPQAALGASRVNPACRDLYERLRAKGKAHRSALVAVGAKLLVQAWAVMPEGKSFEIPERYRVSPSEERTPRTSSGNKPGESAIA